MKNKIYTFLIFSLLAVTVLSSFEKERLEFNTEVIDISDNRIDVIVTITSGKPDFIYTIWDGEPWEGGTEIENSGNTNTTEYTFRNLEKKTYVVMITDGYGLRCAKPAHLPIKE
ncbi:MAG: hypothetical protein JW894_12395 [Bacteroidales bacterium]|nr:hypothetical protein [Bacteroidales bacterium]